MKTVTILASLCISSFIYATVSPAQTNDWTIITSARDTLRSCVIGRFEGDMVNLICGSSVIRIPVDSLSMVTRHKESHFWSGAGYGTLIGTAGGALIGLASYQKPTGAFALDFGPGFAALAGGILGAVTGFTIGGIAGAVSRGDQRYDLSQATTVEKIQILHDVRKQNR